VIVAFIGLGWAYFLYGNVELAKLNAIVQGNAFLRTVHRILYHRYYIEEFYDLLIRYVVLGLSHLEQAFDAYVVDGIVNGIASLITTFGRDVRRVETGRVQAYMVAFFGGVAVLAVIVIALVTFVRG
jgi:NADH:ubiquinone oxidoreductase subunit 5 (subunit L)/multisubunit Na+/H+ antiporter MnhA subunit